MPFITLNGYTVPVESASPRKKFSRRGERTRSVKGQLRDGRRGRRRGWSLTTVCKEQEEGEAIENLVWGKAHVAHFFDGLNAETGLNPVTGWSGVSMSMSVGLGLETGYLILAGSASTPSIQYDAQIDDEWTILWHEGTGAWAGGALRDDGTGYLSGVQNNNAGSTATDVQISVSGGILTITNASASSVNLDQLVMLPWRASEAMMAFWTAVTADAFWGRAPVLAVAGDIIEEEKFYGFGQVNRAEFVQFAGASGWVNNGSRIEFELMESEETFRRGIVEPAAVVVADVPFEVGQWDNTPDPNISADFDSPSNLAEATFDNGWDGTPP